MPQTKGRAGTSPSGEAAAEVSPEERRWVEAQRNSQARTSHPSFSRAGKRTVVGGHSQRRGFPKAKSSLVRGKWSWRAQGLGPRKRQACQEAWGRAAGTKRDLLARLSASFLLPARLCSLSDTSSFILSVPVCRVCSLPLACGYDLGRCPSPHLHPDLTASSILSAWGHGGGGSSLGVTPGSS